MSKVRALSDLGKITDPMQFIRMGAIAIRDIVDVVNGKVEFDVNIACVTVEATFTTANQEVLIPHALGRVPKGYEITKTTAATILYDGTRDPGTQNITLRASLPATVQIRLF